MFWFILGIVLSLCVYGFLKKPTHYGNELENYILSKRPQNAGDIERFTVEYNQKIINEGIIR